MSPGWKGIIEEIERRSDLGDLERTKRIREGKVGMREERFLAEIDIYFPLHGEHLKKQGLGKDWHRISSSTRRLHLSSTCLHLESA